MDTIKQEPNPKANEAFRDAVTTEAITNASIIDSKLKDDPKVPYTVVDGYEVVKKKPTDQASPTPPHLRNPSGKGGFGDNPQNRNPGGWRKEDTARYKLEQIMKFSDKQHVELQKDEDTPTFEKRLSIAVQNGNWKEIEGMINQIYGKPQESVDVTTKGNSMTAPLVRIIDERQKSPEEKAE